MLIVKPGSAGARKRRSTRPSRTPFQHPIRFQSSSRRRAGAPVVPDPFHSRSAHPPNVFSNSGFRCQALRYRGRSRRQPSRSAGMGEAQFLGDRNEIAVARLEGELAAGRDRGGDGSPAEPAPLSPHSCDVRSAAPCRGNVVIYRKQKQVTAIPAKPFGGRRLDTVVRRRLTTRMQTCG